jgi:hypothetical protein
MSFGTPAASRPNAAPAALGSIFSGIVVWVW